MKISYKIFKDINVKEYLLDLGMSKSVIYKLFLNKSVSVNDTLVKENYMLKENDNLEIEYIEENNYKPIEGALDILYEDDYFLIINKPSGIICHDSENSISNIVSYYYKTRGIDLSVKYPHRLDKDTTGVLIFAKDLLTLDYMNKLFTTHDLVRKYLLICEGYLGKKSGVIDLPIGKDRHINGKYRVSKTGVRAVTNYKVLKEFNNKSLVEVELKTGRTHQIRVHFSNINHPLIGDALYGSKINGPRFLLHSYYLEFFHPFLNKKLVIKKDMPNDFLSEGEK